ncbi:hypothetical protein I3842_09G082400 [Carya illinoinensis]|uniref:Uncharacterized protein n=1 Tax=Carya illinoinensis TaxID=32201 RepID=A0A922J6L0_CARIL|nr:hypothetical protein I3842_09G082400 [Carya illinoinensis]
MLSFNPFFLPVVLLLMLGSLSLTNHAADPVPLYHFCANNTFSQNSLYNSSLNSLLSSLSSNVSRNIEFYNTTSGQNTSDPVYGLFLCRGDVTSQMCRTCVAAATKELAAKCSREKVAVIWYDECMIRYSNESIFSTVAVRPRIHLLNTQNITEQDRFNRLVNTTMTDLASRASNFPTGVKKFGTNQTKFSEFQNLYSLVQCTPDLSSADCNWCLQTAINRLPICCGGKQGGRALFPSCNVRYELYPFYTDEPMPPPPEQGPASPTPPMGSAPGSKEWKHKSRLIIPIGVAGIAVISLGIMYSVKRRRLSSNATVGVKRDAKNDHMDAEEMIKSYGSVAPTRYTYSAVKKLTNSFKDKVGRGGYGVVYKGKLPDGRVVAVKVLSESKGNGEEFINEVASVSGTSHVNIVTLLGFCYEKTKRALIYEFVPNGSLDKFIYDDGSSITKCHLDKTIMFQIAVGIARGLEYLHRGCRTRILHLDIKPHNILLDEDLCPKISDFGLAKLCKTKESIVSMTGMRGTAGYIAPEVFSRSFGGVSHKSDVYSYGMLVLEMVGGRKNYDSGVSHTDEIYFPQWIYNKLERDESFCTCEDRREDEEDIVKREVEEDIVKRLIIVSLWCIQTNPLDRPSMGKVITMLDCNFQSLQIPPKPFLNSPVARSLENSSTD